MKTLNRMQNKNEPMKAKNQKQREKNIYIYMKKLYRKNAATVINFMASQKYFANFILLHAEDMA